MQCLRIEDLRNASMPSALPAQTQMGVWKRSTGYEVLIPFTRGWLYWSRHLFLLFCLICVAALAIFAVEQRFPDWGNTESTIFYVGLIAPIIAYIIYIFIKLSETRASKLRIDMSAISLKMLRIYPSGQTQKLRRIPVHHIEDIWIREGRGLRINGEYTEAVWLGNGLNADDLYYLALLIGQVTTLPAPKVYTVDEYS